MNKIKNALLMGAAFLSTVPAFAEGSTVTVEANLLGDISEALVGANGYIQQGKTLMLQILGAGLVIVVGFYLYRLAAKSLFKSK